MPLQAPAKDRAPAAGQHEAEERLLVRLRERSTAQPGQPVALVRADAAVLTGLPAERAEAALKAVARDYRSHLSVTEQGELVYQFEPGLPGRAALPLGERLAHALRPVMAALWRAFTVGFKIWIAATLVLYTILFAVLAIALMVAGNGDDDGPGGWFLWWILPDFGGSRRRLGRYPRDPEDEAPRKRFHRSVFDYVFGAEPADRQAPAAGVGLGAGDDRRLLEYIRQRRGRITASDLVLLTGWDYRRAEEEATRLLLHYDGEPEVGEGGAIVYAFRELRRTAAPAAPSLPGPEQPALPPITALRPRSPAPVPWAWEHNEPTPPLTGNRTGTNVAITAFNGFNLLAALFIGPLFAASPLLWALLITVPLSFSALFFAVPAGRYLVERSRRRRRRRRNLRRSLLWAISSSSRDGGGVAKQELVRLGVERYLHLNPDPDWRRNLPDALRARAVQLAPLAERELERLLRDLEGDVELPGDTDQAALPASVAEVRYCFPRLHEEEQAARRAREAAGAEEQQVGELIFSSASEGAGV